MTDRGTTDSGVTVERATGLELPNSTINAMAARIERFGWPYKKHARGVAKTMLAAALKEGGVVLASARPRDVPWEALSPEVQEALIDSGWHP